MSNNDFELDPSGSLMEQVQALIAPPGSDDKDETQSKSNEHPYFKRPGKGHNHDSCDACGEGGDLICCDKCPSSFHLTCHDPPLDESDIPLGEWLCHSCKYSKKLEPQQRSKRSTSTSSNSSTKSIKKPSSNPMDILVEAAKAINPKQFELPNEMNEPCIFPGTDKIDNLYAKNPTKRKYKNERQLGGIVPLPAEKCYICRRSCRVAPLLACDYCPLLFHLDCLDPPLTTFPSGRWMCPNHVEQLLDAKLLQSVSAVERIRLWDQYRGPVDQDAIKLEFFRAIHRKNAPFRVKVKLKARKKATVPLMVKQHYQSPVELLPSLRDVLRLETVRNRCNEWEIKENDIKVEDMELEDGLKSLNSESDDCDIVDTIENSVDNKDKIIVIEDEKSNNSNGPQNIEVPKRVNGVFDVNGDSKNFLDKALKEIEDKHKRKLERDCKIMDEIKVKKLKKEIINEEEHISTKVENEHLTMDAIKTEDEQNLVLNGMVNGISNMENCVKSEFQFYNEVNVERELRQLDDRLIRLLAVQRIQQIISQPESGNAHLTPFLSNALQSKFRYMPLPSELLTPADIDRISRVFSSPKKKSKPKSNLRARAMLCPVISKYFYNVRTSDVDSIDVRHDASFSGYRPTVSARFPEATAMRYRSISIGKGSANEVELDRYGHCNFVSPKHAVIFYDEYSKNYELINYSCHGTYVNNVLYANDLTERPQKIPEIRTTDMDKHVREIVDKRRKVTRTRKNSADSKMIAIDCLDRMECSCTNNNYEEIKSGWEGTAVLTHGALLRFGCISFVFSIVDCATISNCS